MKKKLFILIGLLISGTMLAQNRGYMMKKYESRFSVAETAEYGLQNEPVIGKMQELLENLVIQSTSVY